MFRSLITAVLALVCLTAPAFAQANNVTADASVSVTVAPFITAQKSLDIVFGTHFAAEGDVPTSASNYAKWLGQSDVGNTLSVSLNVTPALNKQGGTGAVPFSCGSTAALITNDVVSQRFNPAAGIASFGPIAAPGTITVKLGDPSGTPGDAAYLCFVHLANAQRGSYQGFITLTLAVL